MLQQDAASIRYTVEVRGVLGRRALRILWVLKVKGVGRAGVQGFQAFRVLELSGLRVGVQRRGVS